MSGHQAAPRKQALHIQYCVINLGPLQGSLIKTLWQTIARRKCRWSTNLLRLNYFSPQQACCFWHFMRSAKVEEKRLLEWILMLDCWSYWGTADTLEKAWKCELGWQFLRSDFVINFSFSINVFHIHEDRATLPATKSGSRQAERKEVIRLSQVPTLFICLLRPYVCFHSSKAQQSAWGKKKKKSGRNKGAFANIMFRVDKSRDFWGESTINGIRSFIYVVCKHNLKIQPPQWVRFPKGRHLDD